MSAIGDIYEVKHKYRDFDQKLMENVYFYRYENSFTGFGNQSENLANVFHTDFLTPMMATFGASYETYEIAVRNLFDPADQFQKPLAQQGTRALGGSDYQPSFLAAVATAAVSNGLVKKGRKMFAGLIESDQATGQLTTLGFINFAIRAALFVIDLHLLVGGAYVWSPVVVKRIRTGTPGNYVYNLPTSQVQAIFGYIQSAVLSAIVSAQDTRKK